MTLVEVRQQMQFGCCDLTDRVPCMLHVYDVPSGDGVYANAALLNFFRLPLSALDASFYDERLHPEDGAALTTYDEWTMCRLRDSDGQWRWVRHHVTVLNWNDDGSPRRVLSTMIDIDDQQRAINQLMESERRYRQAVENSPNAIFAIDRQRRIMSWNRACERILGYDETIIGTPYRQLLWDDSAGVDDMVGQVFTGDFFTNVNIRYRCADEADRFMFSRLYPVMDQDGVVQQCVFANTDVTEQKAAEKLAMERHRMEILSSFIRDASHEFRTPLSIINSSTHLLTRLTDEDRRTQHIDQIHTQVEAINDLVNALALIARLDSESQPTMELMDVNDMVRVVKIGIARKAEERGVEVVLDLDDQLASVCGNVEYLHHALLNLVGNAIRYSGRGEHVTLSTTYRYGRVAIGIRDTGDGISPDDLPHIFDRFYRRDTAHATRGLGLGLPIARRVAELHDGEITVESTPGEGSLFTVYLPVASAQDQE